MSETANTDEVTDTATMSEVTQTLGETLQLIDNGFGSLTDRELVSSGEMTDLLLDVRAEVNRAYKDVTQISKESKEVSDGEQANSATAEALA